MRIRAPLAMYVPCARGFQLHSQHNSINAIKINLINEAINTINGFATLTITNISDIAFLDMLAAEMMSSCLLLIPAETDLAVAFVIAFVHLIISSGVAPGLAVSVE